MGVRGHLGDDPRVGCATLIRASSSYDARRGDCQNHITRRHAAVPGRARVHTEPKAEALTQAHARDVEVPAYGVSYLRYWFDEATGKVFCLVDAPSPEPPTRCTVRLTGSWPIGSGGQRGRVSASSSRQGNRRLQWSPATFGHRGPHSLPAKRRPSPATNWSSSAAAAAESGAPIDSRSAAAIRSAGPRAPAPSATPASRSNMAATPTRSPSGCAGQGPPDTPRPQRHLASWAATSPSPASMRASARRSPRRR